MSLDITPRLLYRDGLVLIIDKPAGLPVHGGPGGGDNLEMYFDQLRFGLPRPPGLAHRLDRDTSGCLVLGRHPKALRRLGKLFSEGGQVVKTYWALVLGVPEKDQGVINQPLKKASRPGGWTVHADATGQEAVTRYRVLGRDGPRSWIEFQPLTGRTHQIRVHAQTQGWAVIGDRLYGGGLGAGLQLHARHIALPLYPKKPPIEATAPVPLHMAKLLKDFGFSEDQPQT